MKKGIIISILVALILAFIVYFYSTESVFAPVITPDSVTPELVVLPVGRTGTVGDVSIRFNELVADYRCPIDVMCIQAGAVLANVTLTSGEETTTFNLPQDQVPTAFAGRYVSIVSASPEARSTVTINPRDYIVTFKISTIAR